MLTLNVSRELIILLKQLALRVIWSSHCVFFSFIQSGELSVACEAEIWFFLWTGWSLEKYDAGFLGSPLGTLTWAGGEACSGLGEREHVQWHYVPSVTGLWLAIGNETKISSPFHVPSLKAALARRYCFSGITDLYQFFNCFFSFFKKEPFGGGFLSLMPVIVFPALK